MLAIFRDFMFVLILLKQSFMVMLAIMMCAFGCAAVSGEKRLDRTKELIDNLRTKINALACDSGKTNVSLEAGKLVVSGLSAKDEHDLIEDLINIAGRDQSNPFGAEADALLEALLLSDNIAQKDVEKIVVNIAFRYIDMQPIELFFVTKKGYGIEFVFDCYEKSSASAAKMVLGEALLCGFPQFTAGTKQDRIRAAKFFWTEKKDFLVVNPKYAVAINSSDGVTGGVALFVDR